MCGVAVSSNRCRADQYNFQESSSAPAPASVSASLYRSVFRIRRSGSRLAESLCASSKTTRSYGSVADSRNRPNVRSPASVSMLMMTRSLSNPAKGLPARASTPVRMRNRSRNSVLISHSQFPIRPAGGAMSTRRMSRRDNISRMYRPVMMVFPAPASSASRNLSGCCLSMCS